jgi:hypothetical protein
MFANSTRFRHCIMNRITRNIRSTLGNARVVRACTLTFLATIAMAFTPAAPGGAVVQDKATAPVAMKSAAATPAASPQYSAEQCAFAFAFHNGEQERSTDRNAALAALVANSEFNAWSQTSALPPHGAWPPGAQRR